MKKLNFLLLILVSLILISGCTGCNGAYGTETKYKCFAEMFPEYAENLGFMALGELKMYNDIPHVCVAEATNTAEMQWYQLIDFGELDGRPDIGLIFYIGVDYNIYWMHISVNTIMELMENHCKTHNIKMKDFLHWKSNNAI